MSDSLVNEEVPFGIAELFFSRTDPAGIIQSGNAVFQRVSGYSEAELIGKPHKLIRHPDTPRAVFWIFWNTIKQGQPIGAYVKNRSADGRFYWVFAITMPLAQGFLSVRLKPTSDLFAVIQDEYAALRARERTEQITPEQSAALLVSRLKELGYRSYQAFMSEAIAREIPARDAALGRRADTGLTRFADLVKASRLLLERADSIFEAYDKNRHVSLNFQVQAAQLGAAGDAIGQISKNYDVISAEIKNNLHHFVDSAEQVFAVVNEGQFLACASRVQQEMESLFEKEVNGSERTHSDEIPRLREQTRRCHEMAENGLASISGKARRFRGACEEMKRHSAALEVTRIMGKVESARGDNCESLRQLIDELDELQKAIAGNLKDITQLDQLICHDSERLISEAV